MSIYTSFPFHHYSHLPISRDITCVDEKVLNKLNETLDNVNHDHKLWGIPGLSYSFESKCYHINGGKIASCICNSRVNEQKHRKLAFVPHQI
jgi:hypothetical protein